MDVVITSKGNKTQILEDNNREKKFCTYKFYDFKSLKKKLLFDYDDEALSYIMNKYRVNINIARIYVENMYFLKDLENEKVQFLQKIKDELLNLNLLKIDNSFRQAIAKKKVKVWGLNYLTKEEQMLLQELDYEIVSLDLEKNYNPHIYEAQNISEEVEWVMNKIGDLLYQKVDIKKIKLICDPTYNKYLDYFSKLYKIPINIKKNNSYFSTQIAQEFLTNYDGLSILENVSLLKDKYENVDNLITVINKSVLVEDKDLRKEFIIYDLKNTMLEEQVYDNAIEIKDVYDHFKKDDYVFLLGFNLGVYPIIKKDDDFFSDNIKKELGLDMSYELNVLEKNKLCEAIKKIPNLTITYKLQGENGSVYPSLLVDTLGVEVKNIALDYKISYAKLNSQLAYATDLDNLYKFNVQSQNLGLFKNSLQIPYRTYNHKFSFIDQADLKEKLEQTLQLSYTSLEMYYECAFRYYISKILNLNVFLVNFKSIVGSVVHHILELGIDKKIDVSLEINRFIKANGYELSFKEQFFLEMLGEELEEVLEILKLQRENTQLKSNLLELELVISQKYEDFEIIFKGFIDKVMYTNYNGKEVVAVVDYKTGNKNIELDLLQYGLNLQLPIYLYLLKKADRFKDSIIGGFYLQRVLSSVGNIDPRKTLREQKEDNMRLQGFSNSDERILTLLDENFKESKIIKGLKYKKDGTLSSSAKVLNEEDMNDLIKQVKQIIGEGIKEIIQGHFTINPKIVKKKNYSCTYCNFKDICFKDKSDEVVLGGDEDEMDN